MWLSVLSMWRSLLKWIDWGGRVQFVYSSCKFVWDYWSAVVWAAALLGTGVGALVSLILIAAGWVDGNLPAIAAIVSPFLMWFFGVRFRRAIAFFLERDFAAFCEMTKDAANDYGELVRLRDEVATMQSDIEEKIAKLTELVEAAERPSQQ